MTGEIIIPLGSGLSVPTVIAQAGEDAATRFLEFFTANIRNRNTRAAYAQAVRQFLHWCEEKHLGFTTVQPMHVAAYVEQLGQREENPLSDPSIKQHLAAIRMLFDWMVTGHVLSRNPAASVRGPKHVVKRGKTPVLSAADARTLLDSIYIGSVVGLRDRALIAVMIYSFARIGAVTAMKVEDYYQNGKRWWLRLHEKGGKFHELPAHHQAEEYLDAYLQAAGIAENSKGPLFRSARGNPPELTERPLRRNNALDMVKRRARAAGLSDRICCHTFRATGITAYLHCGGTLEKAQQIAAHESPKTTKLYDRTSDQVTLDEIEKIQI
jgi:site-specific recombinase XerD